ncbi:hypothetical protein PUR25_00135, partial [Streptomyces sp. JV181]|uniref:hypothetical protein n=1 Tax=Streptomyces sp. JV181 TaxID=858635 RepID=UPI002E77985D
MPDNEFHLFEVLGRDTLDCTGPFAEIAVDTAQTLRHEVTRLAENALAETYAAADRNPPVFD